MGRQRLYMNDRGRSAMHDDGFSWLAGASLLVWALQRRLYRFSLVGLMLHVGFTVLTMGQSAAVHLALYVVNFVACGALANRVHRLLLERSGWCVTAEEPQGNKAG
jgi:hypothetical protein